MTARQNANSYIPCRELVKQSGQDVDLSIQAEGRIRQFSHCIMHVGNLQLTESMYAQTSIGLVYFACENCRRICGIVRQVKAKSKMDY